MTDRIELECPTCKTEIVVDPETKAILMSREPKRAARGDLDSMIAGIVTGKESRDSLFEKQMSQQKNRERVLDAKFKAAVEKAKKDDGSPSRPINPMDLD